MDMGDMNIFDAGWAEAAAPPVTLLAVFMLGIYLVLSRWVPDGRGSDQVPGLLVLLLLMLAFVSLGFFARQVVLREGRFAVTESPNPALTSSGPATSGEGKRRDKDPVEDDSIHPREKEAERAEASR